jgi:hypothetical protein
MPRPYIHDDQNYKGRGHSRPFFCAYPYVEPRRLAKLCSHEPGV